MARSNLIFGLHVHVGIEDKEAAIRIMNSMRYFLPHIMALTTNSPFWLGLNTGYKGYRAKVFENFPRTGIPDAFASYSEYDNYVNLLIKTNCIANGKKIWWDIRPASGLRYGGSQGMRYSTAGFRDDFCCCSDSGYGGLLIQAA